MIIKEITIRNSSGLHARPASMWVQMASRYQSSIKIKSNNSEVDGKSILGILSLGLASGSQFELIVDGKDEQEAAESLETLVNNLENQGE
ncbi:HPr family phosphocarrier protein [Desulfosporosinus sp. BICA1-9]|uniref:HPr family phosphocarrier protein n=1 Tax=Desulfosporosinus sp. BICA1-9 TaxID=1531958 RepID=UPI00054BB995|nr:HPr family phosphocarrier protein [Desulfosporosinus sp. BICA1-9]KJS50291.1 MAG: phosphocarrier protein HPr [Peptococcaceae bacterium BRH_c23]KJS85083.1 MAG: phosphocarrier protein HPr [Desulfosporosinus sp. BICA1-9]HBW34101.1 HPr family phosphocarrier protein [Desulfosporosinus sp.]